MSISVRCSGCAKKLTAKAELAGKRVKCPSCGQVVVVPADDSPVARTSSPAPKLPPPADRAERQTPPRSRTWRWVAVGVAAVVVTAGVAVAIGLILWLTRPVSLDDAIRAAVGGATVTAQDEWDGADGQSPRALVAAGDHVYYFKREARKGWSAAGKKAILQENSGQKPPAFLAFSPKGNGAIIAFPYEGSKPPSLLLDDAPEVYSGATFKRDFSGGHQFTALNILGDSLTYGAKIDEEITPEGQEALREKVASFLRKSGGYEEGEIRLMSSVTARNAFRKGKGPQKEKQKEKGSQKENEKGKE